MNHPIRSRFIPLFHDGYNTPAVFEDRNRIKGGIFSRDVEVYARKKQQTIRMYEPYVSNPDEWKRHFVDMAQNGYKPKKFYVLSSQSGSGSVVSNDLKLVTPTEQAVEQAKAELLRSRESLYMESDKPEKTPVKRMKIDESITLAKRMKKR